MPSTLQVTSVANAQVRTAGRDPALWQLSQELESTFLTEMLKTAGLGKINGEFAGGIGEDQLSGFLTQRRAAAMVENGGIGLAESIYRSLTLPEDTDVRRR